MNPTREQKLAWIEEIAAKPSVVAAGRFGRRCHMDRRRERVRFIVEAACDACEEMQSSPNWSDTEIRQRVKRKYQEKYGNPVLFLILFNVVWYFVKRLILDKWFE